MQVTILDCSSQLIHLGVTPRVGDGFMCTFIYGATCKQDRLRLFQHLEPLSKGISSPWLVLGDFNCIANLDEWIGAPVRVLEVTPLCDCMAECGLHDLQYSGRFFTWSNKQAGSQRVLSKIDRVLGNVVGGSFPDCSCLLSFGGSL